MRNRYRKGCIISSFLSALCLFLLASSDLNAQALQTDWLKKYGSSFDDFGQCILQTADGGFLVGITSSDTNFSGSHGGYDILLTKTDKQGNVTWSKMYGGSENDELTGSTRAILETGDGGFVVAGVSKSNDGDVTGAHDTLWLYSDAWVFKIDNLGAMQWQRAIGGLGNEHSYALQPTPDNGFLLLGSTSSNDGDFPRNLGPANQFGHYAPDIFVVKLDANGTTLWQKSYGGSLFDIPSGGIYALNDGNYIISGRTQSNDGDVTNKYPGTSYDNWLIKIDGSGSLIWEKCFGGSGNDLDFAFAQKPNDDGFMLAVSNASTDGTYATLSRKYDYCLLRLDSSANIQWIKTYGGSGNEAVKRIIWSKDGSYLIAGGSYSNDGDVKVHYGAFNLLDVWLLRVDDTGKILSNNVIGGYDIDVISSIIETRDSGYILAGFSASTNGHFSGLPAFGGYDAWVLKLKKPVTTSTGSVSNAAPHLQVYPTVCEDLLHVDFVGRPQDAEISLLNVTGAVIEPTAQISRNTVLSLRDMVPGMYILRVKTAEALQFYRILKPGP